MYIFSGCALSVPIDFYLRLWITLLLPLVLSAIVFAVAGTAGTSNCSSARSSRRSEAGSELGLRESSLCKREAHPSVAAAPSNATSAAAQPGAAGPTE